MRSIFSLLAFAILLPAQSQPPTPSPPKDTQGKQKEGASKKDRVDAKDGQGQTGAAVVNQHYSQPDNEDKHESKTEQDKGASSEWINTASTVLLAVSTFLLFIATIALCVVAGLQLRTMNAHKQSLEAMAEHLEGGLTETRKAADAALIGANAAKDSLQANINQFELMQRPWCTISMGAFGNLSFSKEGVSLDCAIAITNTGQSPATSMHFDVALKFSHEPGQTITAIRDTLTDRVLKSSTHGYVIFPKETARLGHVHTHNVSNLPEQFFITAVVAVAYQPTFNASKKTTSTIFYIRHRTNSTFKRNENVSRDDLRFDTDPAYGTMAT